MSSREDLLRPNLAGISETSLESSQLLTEIALAQPVEVILEQAQQEVAAVKQQYQTDENLYAAAFNFYHILSILTPIVEEGSELHQQIVNPSDMTKSERDLVELICQTANDLAGKYLAIAERPKNDAETEEEYKAESEAAFDLGENVLLVETVWAQRFGIDIFQLKAITNRAKIRRTKTLNKPPEERRSEFRKQVDNMKTWYELARTLRASLELSPEKMGEMSIKFLGNLLNHIGVFYLDLAETETDPERIMQALESARKPLQDGVSHLSYVKEENLQGNQKLIDALKIARLALQSNLAQVYILDYGTQFEHGDVFVNQFGRSLQGDLLEHLKPFLRGQNEKSKITEPFRIEAPIRAAHLIGFLVRKREVGGTADEEYYDRETPLINTVLTYIGDLKLSTRMGTVVGESRPTRQDLISVVQALYIHAAQIVKEEGDSLDIEDRIVFKRATDEFLGERKWFGTPTDEELAQKSPEEL